MKVMVPWSSGLDSTSLVVSNLEKGNIGYTLPGETEIKKFQTERAV